MKKEEKKNLKNCQTCDENYSQWEFGEWKEEPIYRQKFYGLHI